jgi:uncharacterized lipoprotein YajG
MNKLMKSGLAMAAGILVFAACDKMPTVWSMK